MKDEVRREVQFTVPPGSVEMLKRLPGFGLKDAPRLWNKLLTEELKTIGLKPLQSDPLLCGWHVNEPAKPLRAAGYR